MNKNYKTMIDAGFTVKAVFEEHLHSAVEVSKFIPLGEGYFRAKVEVEAVEFSKSLDQTGMTEELAAPLLENAEVGGELDEILGRLLHRIGKKVISEEKEWICSDRDAAERAILVEQAKLLIGAGLDIESSRLGEPLIGLTRSAEMKNAIEMALAEKQADEMKLITASCAPRAKARSMAL